ncbi:DNA helicase HerA-like ATPase [Neorhizobium huautlense]|uniref:DNA helicase HerA-like ATPase n=1 Tax=Neorhizobium huautlense TaxID=67774 RepID=A0ABT9PSS4_9HYPH|nr:DNA helicase HerA-like ATPase [Neorhizobium huautlense]
MRNSDFQKAMTAGEQERRDGDRPGNRLLGRIVACNGAHATIAAVAENGETGLTELWSIGRLISISVGTNRVVAISYSMSTDKNEWIDGADNEFRIEVELLGEVRVSPDGREEFSRGISRYPYLGAIAHRIRSADLVRIYDTGQSESCVIGKLTQDESIDATIHIPSMLSKHFAVVGSTGVGKSTAVSLLLNKAIEADPKLRVLILDPHNEFAAAFPEKAVVIDTDTLDLPFWLMRLEEFAEVVFRGRTPVAEELDILRDLIPEAKRAFRGSENSLMRRTTEKSSVTADTPVPYRMADLLALIDERIGRLEGRSEKPVLRSLKMRVTSAINDPRYHFMFSNNTIQDTIMETIAHIFRIPGEDRPISTFQLAGIPSEVVNSVASILCRMSFELALWSNGAIHMLVVCEEAHRYVPADRELGFVPTRQAIARIAKEGRKYGVSLGVITQRPGELDQTILSQCSTVFAMRLANDKDQEIIRSAIPNSSVSTTSFLSSIGNGEAIAFGEAITVPMRMRFTRVDQSHLPKANGVSTAQHSDDETPDTVDLRSVVSRMRSVAGPDISNFQRNVSSQGFSPSQADSYIDDADDGASDVELARWNSEMRTDDVPPLAPHQSGHQHSAEGLEPYRPDMLPRAPRDAEPARQPRFTEFRRDAAPDYGTSNRNEPARPAFGRPEGTGSFRESLLKKPLSSLYDKD